MDSKTMIYMVPLWKWERGFHMADESLIMLHFDPERKTEKTWIERTVEKWLSLWTR